MHLSFKKKTMTSSQSHSYYFFSLQVLLEVFGLIYV